MLCFVKMQQQIGTQRQLEKAATVIGSITTLTGHFPVIATGALPCRFGAVKTSMRFALIH